MTARKAGGESTPFGGTYIAARARGARAGTEDLAPHLLGRDPRETDRIHDATDEVLVGHAHAKAAIDIARRDLFGKAVGRPVCEPLGDRAAAPDGGRLARPTLHRRAL